VSQVIEPCLDCNAPATVTIQPYGAGSMAEISCPNCGVSYDTNLDALEIPERTLNDLVKEAREHEAN